MIFKSQTARTIMIAGEAGFGIMSAGAGLGRALARIGYHVFSSADYPSLIRGGHNAVFLTYDTAPIFSIERPLDLVLALTPDTIHLHHEEFAEDCLIIADDKEAILEALAQFSFSSLVVPLARTSKEVANSVFLRNAAALGALFAAMSLPDALLESIIISEFGRKNPKVGEENLAVARRAGELFFQIAKLKRLDLGRFHLDNSPNRLNKKTWFLSGNEVVGLAGLSAGVDYVSIYPMTPTSNILHFYAGLPSEVGVVAHQAEDEISAINSAIGASFAGARSLTATSGGGFCLMSEGYGLSAMTETPLVIIEGMRGSPATGLPTYSEQGDLRFVLHAHQGDFPRLVVAPGDHEEIFTLTRAAFRLAEIYQTPVIVLLDKHLCEGLLSVDEILYEEPPAKNLIIKKQSDYKRYALTPDGISKRSVPGVGNMVIANSDEHDERGYSIDDLKTRDEQMKKRMKKFETFKQTEDIRPVFLGADSADILVVVFGSTKGVARDAVGLSSGRLAMLHIPWLSPFPDNDVKNIINKFSHVFVCEHNETGQLTGLIAEKTGIIIKDKLLRSDGRVFSASDILNFAFEKYV